MGGKRHISNTCGTWKCFYRGSQGANVLIQAVPAMPSAENVLLSCGKDAEIFPILAEHFPGQPPSPRDITLNPPRHPRGTRTFFIHSQHSGTSAEQGLDDRGQPVPSCDVERPGGRGKGSVNPAAEPPAFDTLC